MDYLKTVASNLLEKRYNCEINCVAIDKSVHFAHHARGCTIIAAKILALADKILTEKLGIKKNSAILKRTRYSFDHNDVPLEYTIGYYKAEGYNYVITLVQEK